MADKVQAILEDTLSDAMFLAKKGVFSSEELRIQMLTRQRAEHAIIKPTRKVTDFLKAIEFEYSLERVRRHRVKNSEQFKLDPRFRKSDTRDHMIVKRLIRLWDRTMHTFRFRMDLWKQYLAFCYTLESKKHFYKALSNAVSFNPFQLDLWLAGVNYEFQVHHNPWKARKVFLKGLKTNKENVQFWKEYLLFQLEFAKLIAQRQKLIKGDNGTQIIMEGQQELVDQTSNQIEELEGNLAELLSTVIQQAFNSVANKQLLLTQFIQILKDCPHTAIKETVAQVLNNLEQQFPQGLSSEQTIKHLIHIDAPRQYQETINKLTGMSPQQKLQTLTYFGQTERKGLVQLITTQGMTPQQKLRYHKISVQLGFNQEKLTQAIKDLGLHPSEYGEYLNVVVPADPIHIFRRLLNSKTKIPDTIGCHYLEKSTQLGLSKIQIVEMLKRINTDSFYRSKQCVQRLCKYYSGTGEYEKIADVKRRYTTLSAK